MSNDKSRATKINLHTDQQRNRDSELINISCSPRASFIWTETDHPCSQESGGKRAKAMEGKITERYSNEYNRTSTKLFEV